MRLRFCSCVALGLIAVVGFGRGLHQSDFRPGAPQPQPEPKLPKAFCDAAKFVLAHGLADPRGGKLVTAETKFGSKIGWLVPAKGGKPEYLAASDGLSYEGVTQVHEAEITVLYQAGPRNPGPFLMHGEGMSSVPLVAAMAYLHGDEHIAVQLSHGALQLEPFLWTYWFSHDYLADRLMRATLAHESGDEEMALEDSRRLLSESGAFQQEAKKVVGPDHKFLPFESRFGDSRYFPFVSQAKPIEKDAERRLKIGNPGDPDLTAISKLDKKAQIRKLIEALDHVRPETSDDYTLPTYLNDPIVKALVNEGQDAIEPLVNVFDKEERITRSHRRSRFGFDSGPQPFVPVREIEIDIYQSVLQFNLISWKEGRWDSSPRKPLNADDLRSFWRKMKGLTPAQGWVKVLEDDKAGDRAWYEAAQRLTDPVGTVRTFDSRVQLPADDGRLKMQAESLSPSERSEASKVLARRAEESVQLTPTGDERHPFESGDALQMAVALAKLDSATALPTLKFVSQSAMRESLTPTVEYFGPVLAEALSARIRLGDNAAFTDYGKWVATIHPVLGGFNNPYFATVFEPVVEFRDRPDMQAIAEHLFLDKTSEWNQVAMSEKAPYLQPSPLLDVPAFVASTLNALNDKTVVGKAGRYGRAVDTPTTSYMLPTDYVLPANAPPNEENAYRACDAVAMRLRDLDGAPEFEPYWSAVEKDKAIGQIVVFLQQNSGHLSSRVKWPANWKQR